MLKVLIFAVRFAKKRRFVFLLYLLSLSLREPEKRYKKKNEKKNFRKHLVVKIKPLTFAPAFKTKVRCSLKY